MSNWKQQKENQQIAQERKLNQKARDHKNYIARKRIAEIQDEIAIKKEYGDIEHMCNG